MFGVLSDGESVNFYYDGSTEIRTMPKNGKTVYFLSMLPDRKKDGISQQFTNPITNKEEMGINLRVSDPFRQEKFGVSLTR
mmetsp:Transcript_36440/g.43547  ORF Transcript_36440/g.43547 Transcript_36440/m.43547 type:complete len:81 (-) Transcript_36440:91-333(-)